MGIQNKRAPKTYDIVNWRIRKYSQFYTCKFFVGLDLYYASDPWVSICRIFALFCKVISRKSELRFCKLNVIFPKYCNNFTNLQSGLNRLYTVVSLCPYLWTWIRYTVDADIALIIWRLTRMSLSIKATYRGRLDIINKTVEKSKYKWVWSHWFMTW